MAHQITQRADGKSEFAFIGDRKNVWHGLGQELTRGAPIEDWIVESGLAWEIFESGISYQSMDGEHTYPDRRVLFRSDTKEPLSIVGKDYKIVQPAQVLEFFRDLTSLHGMTLSAAGSLFGGKRFWATAEIGKSFQAVDGDLVNGYLLLVTSADGTVATTAKTSSIRSICSNTLSVALKETGRKIVKKSHRTEWDAEAVKLDMGLVDESWNEFSKSIKRLAEIEVTDKFVTQYFQKKVYAPNVLAEDQSPAKIKEVDKLLQLYNSGMGSSYSRGTAWGVVNAATELHTHGTGNRDASHQFWNSNFGRSENFKNDVLTDMLALAA